MHIPSVSALAVIPARGGSKGIPRKNIRPCAGRPLLSWLVEQCNLSRRLTRTVVSTDDAEIAAVAREWGADVVMRPAEISGDTATSESALLHALSHLRETEGYVPDLTLFLQCTSPLTLAEDIDRSIEILFEEEADTVVSVTDFHYFLWKKDADGNGVGINHDKRIRPRRQDREPQYLETGSVYVFRTPGFLEHKHRFFGRTAFYHLPLERVLEIDEPDDLHRAGLILAARAAAARGTSLPEKIGALVLDFDGVMTDNRVLVLQDGTEGVLCTRADGFGTSALSRLGIPVLVLSTEKNPVVSARCSKLRLACLQGVDDKASALRNWLSERGVAPSDTIYVGNDINDLDAMALVGCAVAPADAWPEARSAARILLERRGGEGAVREICEMIVSRLNRP